MARRADANQIIRRLITPLLLLALVAPLQTSLASFLISKKIARDEHVIFFPTQAWQSKDGKNWHVEIHGWIFEVNLARRIRNFTRRFFLGKKTDNSKEYKRLLKQRSHWFFVDSERNKIVSIRLMGKTWVMKKSGPNGHFYGRLVLPVKTVNTWKLDQYQRVRFSAVMQPKDKRSFHGTIEFVAPRGISIISDVDDTIKNSGVHNKRLLLRNTFVNPYKAIPGMSRTYRRWARHRKVNFHYLTASPWQLYIPLSKFLHKAKFPAGSFHMKYFRFKDRTFFNVFKSSVKYKAAEIRKLLKRYPQRRFVLIGDSGEHDIDVYMRIAAEYPRRIRSIFIHETKPRPIKAERYKPVLLRKMRCPIFVFKTGKRPANLKFY